MTISVAMCTYNGARYIQEQLRSILAQTRKVDEIVICDDGSKDETLDIIQYTAQSSSVTIRVIQNKKNLGFFRNFLQAISLCTGDIIFLSDQDDVWQDDKVEKICDWFNSHVGKDVVFTDALLIDDHNHEFTKDTLWERVGFDARMRKYFDDGYAQEIWTINNRATGATMAFRKSFVKGKDLSSYNLPVHDYIISLLAVIEDSCGYINDTLTYYRIHPGQTIGAAEYAPYLYSPLRAYTIELDNVQHLPDNATCRLEFMRERENFYGQRLGVLNVFACIGKYKTLYGKWWYRFVMYDICQSGKRDLNHLGKLLLKPFLWMKRKK